METMLCAVSGIQNKTNKTQLKNALNKIEGVSEVGVSLTTGTVRVGFNSPATENAVKSGIENAGFKIIYE